MEQVMSRAGWILVVDDHAAARYALGRTLRSRGFEVREAANGIDALRLAEDGPELVLLDIHLPDLSGLEVCRRLRSSHRTAALPIVHMSASYTETGDRVRGLEAGADAYLTEPIDTAELLATIGAVLAVRRAERRAWAAEQEWSSTFEAIRDGLALVAADGAVLRHNGSFGRIMGATEASLQGSPLADLFRARFGGWPGPTLEPGLRITAECVHEGSTWRCVVDPVSSPTGPARHVVILEDVTEAWAAFRRAEESEATLRMALDASRAAIFVWDLDRRALEVDLAYRGIFGFSPHEPVGLDEAASRIHPDDLSLVLEEAARCVDQGVDWAQEFRMLHPQRGERWIAAFGRGYGQPGARRMVGVNFDVTESRRSDEERRKLSEALARSNEELQQFAYAVSHDLREPLRTVASFTGLLRRRLTGLDPETAEILDFVVGGATRMSEMIEGMLRVAQVARRDLELEAVPLPEVLAECVADLRRAVDEVGADIRIGPLPTVTADRTQVRQLFQNVLGNALKFLRPGIPGMVEVASARRADGWTIWVRDNGQGIPASQLDRVFRFFHRANPDVPGLGIGLPLARKVAERHGGHLWLESEAGQGTTVYLFLPDRTAATPAAD